MPIAAGQAYYHASYSMGIVALSFFVAALGSFAALAAAARIPSSTGTKRTQWEITTAVALGGGAIGAMNVVGMLAYRIGPDMTFRLPLLAVAIVIAIVLVGVGIRVVGRDPGSVRRLVGGGVLAGFGIAGMHYTGVAALRTPGPINYDRPLVLVSVAIALVAALAAFWIVFHVGGPLRVLLAVLVMAVAVCGMHYTAMAATRIGRTAPPTDTAAIDPYILAYMITFMVTVILLFVVLAAFGGLSDTQLTVFYSGSRSAARERAAALTTGELDTWAAGDAPVTVPAPAEPAEERAAVVVEPFSRTTTTHHRRRGDLLESARETGTDDPYLFPFPERELPADAFGAVEPYGDAELQDEHALPGDHEVRLGKQEAGAARHRRSRPA